MTKTQLMTRGLLFVGLLMGAGAVQAQDRVHQPWTVQQAWVSAHENFLAGEALQGRGSATRDEAIAAAYVAAQFEGFGLTPAPGMTSYFQTAGVTRIIPSGAARLTVGDVTAAEGEGLTLYYSGGRPVSGAVGKADADPASMPSAPIVLVADMGQGSPGAWIGAATAKGVGALVLRETDALASVSRPAGARPTPGRH